MACNLITIGSCKPFILQDHGLNYLYFQSYTGKLFTPQRSNLARMIVRFPLSKRGWFAKPCSDSLSLFWARSFRTKWSTPVKILLAKCGWLIVRQLAKYHTVLIVYKVLKTGTPSYISSMFSTDYRLMTRQSLQGVIKPSPRRSVERQELTAKSFRFRAVHDYNLHPVQIKEVTRSELFKK